HHRIALLTEALDQLIAPHPATGDLNPDKNQGLLIIGVAIVELGDIALLKRLDELLEAAGTLGNFYGDDRFTLLTDFGALGDITQTVKVHVGAANDRQQINTCDSFPRYIFLQASYRQSSSGFGNRAGILKDVFDRGTNLIGIHRDDLIDAVSTDFPGQLANLAHRNPIRKQPHIRQGDALISTQRRVQTG